MTSQTISSKIHSFTSLLERHSRERGQQTAYLDRDQPLTFRELHEQSHRLAQGLVSVGVREGDRVALWLPNCHAWLLTFLACAHLGATVFAVNTRFREREVEDILDRGRIDWLVLWPDFKGIAFDEILEGVSQSCIERIRGVICYTEEGVASEQDLRGRPTCRYRELISQEGGRAIENRPDLAERGVLTFTTSGTTSLPKFVLHSQRTLIEHGLTVAHAFGYDDLTRVLVSTPMCGAFGFATLISGLAHGVCLVSDPVFDPSAAASAVRRHSVTHTFANNESILKMMESAQGPEDFTTVKVFGFANFSPALGDFVQQACNRNLTLCGLYGSSELLALVAAQHFVAPEADVDLQYLPGGRLVHTEARVRTRDPETGAILSDRQSGELEIFAPSLMVGYLDNPEATARALTADGYFRTGDLGFTVNDRQFVFETRIGDSLRLSGFLVNPAEIEAAVDDLPGVAASQVVGVKVGDRLVPYAFVVLEPGAKTDELLWRETCGKRMANFKVPVGFHVLEAFPSVVSANATKIQRNRLREIAEELLAPEMANGL